MKFYNYPDIQKRKNLKKNKAKVSKNDISSIIYTSGTTGNPKGVILSHRSIMHNLLGAIELISDFNLNKERFISFLPLSHSYERMAGLYFALLINAEIFFCTSTEKLLLEIKKFNQQFYLPSQDCMKVFIKKLNHRSDPQVN